MTSSRDKTNSLYKKSDSQFELSIAIATFNGARYIRHQLNSLANQALLPCELVICDDQSKDDTRACRKVFRTSVCKPLLKIIRQLEDELVAINSKKQPYLAHSIQAWTLISTRKELCDRPSAGAVATVLRASISSARRWASLSTMAPAAKPFHTAADSSGSRPRGAIAMARSISCANNFPCPLVGPRRDKARASAETDVSTLTAGAVRPYLRGAFTSRRRSHRLEASRFQPRGFSRFSFALAYLVCW